MPTSARLLRTPATWLVIVGLLAWGSARAGGYAGEPDAPFERHPLRGLAALAVGTDGFGGAFTRYGLGPEVIRREAAQLLARHGIPVVSRDEAAVRDDAALLEVRWRANDSYYGYYSYALGLRVLRKLPLPGSDGGFVSREVWSDGVVGNARRSELRTHVRRYLPQLVERLAAAWRASQPDS